LSGEKREKWRGDAEEVKAIFETLYADTQDDPRDHR